MKLGIVLVLTSFSTIGAEFPPLRGVGHLPRSLTELGSSLLGQKRVAELFRGMANVTTLSALGRRVHLISLAKDDTIMRLKYEFAKGKDSYGLKRLDSATPLILDIGGNIGFITSLASRLHDHSQIIVFEPSPATYFCLRINLWLNKVNILTSEELQLRPRAHGVYPVFGGLGGQAPFELLDVDEAWKESSMVERANYQSQNVIMSFTRPGNVPIYNLPTFMEIHGLTSRVFDLVKLDCECCEYPLLPQVSNWITNRSAVKRLAGEVHPCPHIKGWSTVSRFPLELLRQRGCKFPRRIFNPNGDLIRTADLAEWCH